MELDSAIHSVHVVLKYISACSSDAQNIGHLIRLLTKPVQEWLNVASDEHNDSYTPANDVPTCTSSHLILSDISVTLLR